MNRQREAIWERHRHSQKGCSKVSLSQHRGIDEQRPMISESLLKWSENIRVCIGNNQKPFFMAEPNSVFEGLWEENSNYAKL